MNFIANSILENRKTERKNGFSESSSIKDLVDELLEKTKKKLPKMNSMIEEILKCNCHLTELKT